MLSWNSLCRPDWRTGHRYPLAFVYWGCWDQKHTLPYPVTFLMSWWIYSIIFRIVIIFLDSYHPYLVFITSFHMIDYFYLPLHLAVCQVKIKWPAFKFQFTYRCYILNKCPIMVLFGKCHNTSICWHNYRSYYNSESRITGLSKAEVKDISIKSLRVRCWSRMATGKVNKMGNGEDF